MGYERVEAELTGPSAWSALEHLPEVGSTNDVAVERIRAGVPGGLVVVTDRQTAGRGRRGRPWQDRPGGSLLVSFVTGVPPRGASLVPLATGLAVSDALRRQGVDARLKWPNDVLVSPAGTGAAAKCAGILVERHDDTDVGSFLVIGVGINLDWRGAQRDTEAAAWASVAEVTGDDVERWDVLADLMRALSAWLRDVAADPTRLLASYRSRCLTLGQQVRIATPTGEIVGSADGLDPGGALVVGTDGGAVTVTAGDVEHLRPLAR